MSVLVTGGAGYIGSHAVRELLEAGKDVIVYDNLSKGHKKSIKNVPLIIGDLLDTEVLDKTVKEYKVTSVVHFAAKIEVGESMAEPEKYYVNNVAGSLNLLKVMHANNVKSIVFSSTAALYGDQKKMPITEEYETVPTNVYGRTKLMIETILKDFSNAYGLNYAALRYFNVAGAHISGEIGENHKPESHLIPIILQVLLGKREKIYIFGTDYPTKDGTCIRDYIHVSDLAAAHVLALDRIEKDKKSLIYNLGNGNGFSVREVINVTEKVTGMKVNVEEAERRAGDPALLIASSDKIIKELGWKPKYNSLEKIIETAWNWHKNHPDGFVE